MDGKTDKPYMKFRSDLEISKQEASGKIVYVIKDPVNSRFFRLKEMEYFIANLFDGKTECKLIADKFNRKYKVQISVDQIEKFAQKLSSIGLLQGDSYIEKRDPVKSKRSLFGKLLFIKLKAINPEQFVEKTYKYARPLYSRAIFKYYFVLTITALSITLANIDDMIYQAQRFFIPEIIPLVWITIFFVTLLHELSHTYSCRLYGGKVTDMGFLLLYFQPCFYSNVSDAYLFPDRKKRIAVTLAGIVSQIIVWALAVIVWRITAMDNIINSIAFIIIALSFIGITFNVNPLLKLDGYYFLVDFFEIPNLRQKAFLYLRQRTLGLAPGETKLQSTVRENKIFFYYGLLSLTYSGALIGYIVYRVGKFINYHLGAFGLAALVLILLYFIIDAMNKSKITKIVYNQRGAILKPNRLIISGVVILVVLLALIFVRAPLRITNDCVVLPFEQINLYSTSPGSAQLYIQKVNEEKLLKQYQLVGQDFSVLSIVPAFKVGDIVQPGDLIARITSNVYESEKLERYANLESAKQQLNLLVKGPQTEEIKQTQDIIKQAELKIRKSSQDLNRAESLFARGIIPENQIEEKRTTDQVLKSELDFYKNQLVLLKRGARPEEIDMAKARVDQLEARLKHLESQLEQTVIESPIYGVVTQVNNGDTIISISRMDSLRVKIMVPEKEISAVRQGNSFKMKVRSYPGLTYSGEVIRIDPLVFHVENNREILWVYGHVPNKDELLKPGMTGKAKINCGKRPLYKLFLWRIIRFLRIEFWSWW